MTTSVSAGGYSTSVAITPTVQNAAYSSGNVIGGLLTVPFFRHIEQASALLNNISVASKGGATTAITFYIFNANPTASTVTDKVAFSLAAADVSKLIAVTPIVLTPAVVGAGATATFASSQAPIAVRNQDSPVTLNLYVVAVVGGAVTPGATSDLVFTFGGLQD